MSDPVVSGQKNPESRQTTQQSRPGTQKPQQPLGKRMRKGFHRRRISREQRRRDAQENRAQRRFRRRDRRASAAAKRSISRRDSVFVSLVRSYRVWNARRQVRAASRGSRVALPETVLTRWRRWRGQRHVARAKHVSSPIIPSSMMKRWRQWRWTRTTARAKREPRTLLPDSWRKRWHKWNAGAEQRIQRRREIYGSFVPSPVRMWWAKKSLPQRTRVRRAVLGSTLVLTISFAAITCEPTRRVPGARFMRMVNSKDDYSAYTNLVRVPGLAIPEISQREQLLRPARTVPQNPPSLKCGPEAFRSALSSDFESNSIRSVVCAGNYGIARVRATSVDESASLTFFAVDSTGRWRIVSIVSNDADVAETLPDGFPTSLITKWANR